MRQFHKFSALATAFWIAASFALPLMAQPASNHHHRRPTRAFYHYKSKIEKRELGPYAHPLILAPSNPYSSYQAPDGTYDSLSDFVRSVNGTPCGIQCSLDHQQRWSHSDSP